MNSLREHRKLQNLTQEELAQSSGVSIRTIQRMEKGVSLGSPHTIRTLARVLKIESTDLVASLPESDELEKSVNSKINMLNLSSLVGIFIPFANVIIPFIVFFKFKKSDKKVNTLGRKILSFQIIWLCILPFSAILMSLVFGRGNGAIPLGTGVAYIVYVAGLVIVAIRTAIKINQEKEILEFIPNIL